MYRHVSDRSNPVSRCVCDGSIHVSMCLLWNYPCIDVSMMEVSMYRCVSDGSIHVSMCQ